MHALLSVRLQGTLHETGGDVKWDVLGTDVPKLLLYTYLCWMRSMRVHADWGRAGRPTNDSSPSLDFTLV